MENQGGEGSKDRDEAASQEKDNGEANLKNKSKSRSASENISSPNSPADGNEGTIDARKSKLMVEEGAEWFLKIKDLGLLGNSKSKLSNLVIFPKVLFG